MSNKKQSSVEWLFDQMSNVAAGAVTKLNSQEMLEKAKQMHKEEIVDAHAVGRIKQCAGVLTDGYEYYNKEFGGNE